MEKILAGGANTDGKEIAAFEQKASFKIRVVRNAYRFCSVIFTALLLCLAGCDNEWDASKDLTIGQDWIEEAETDTADRLESDLFREDEGSEPQSGWTNTADGAPFGEKDLSAQFDTAFSYGYSQLSGDEEQLYREILNSLISYQEETELSVKDPEMVERVFRYVMADHPEIFYADGYEVTTYRLGTELRRITFTGTWTLEVLARRAQLEAAAALWLEGLPDGTDDFEKAKYIYDVLILRTEYEQGSADSQTICSVLLNQRSVCQGYAKTFQYLCQLADSCDARYRRSERGRTCLEYRFPRRGLVLHRSDLGRRFLSERRRGRNANADGNGQLRLFLCDDTGDRTDAFDG